MKFGGGDTCLSFSSCALQRFAEPQGCLLPGYRVVLHLSPPASPEKVEVVGGEVGKIIPVHLEAGAQSPPDATFKLRASFYFAAVIIIYHYY